MALITVEGKEKRWREGGREVGLEKIKLGERQVNLTERREDKE